MDVGIRELKAKLSEYLDRASRGETIRVTERGRPKAILGPLPLQQRIEQGIAEGWITPPRGKGPRKQVTPVKGKYPIQQIIDEDRGD